MARPLCIEYPGAVYHVMNRGGSRQKIFLDEKDRQVFLDTIGENPRSLGSGSLWLVPDGEPLSPLFAYP